MRNDENDGAALSYGTTGGRDAQGRIPDMPEDPMHGRMTNNLSVATAHLVEASCRARDGDLGAAREYIARAVALLHWNPGFTDGAPRALSKARDAAADGGTDAGYDLLVRCLRTGEVHGLRMVLAGGGPLTEEPSPATHRSLSRREAGVLQMMAQGMSNKCIARSLGIAPETVKTHAKGILSKLDARTRAQAVARAEAIGLL